MYQGFDIEKKEDKIFLIIKVTDELTIKRLISEKALEALISKYRTVKDIK